MKTAMICAISTPDAPGYVWKWTCTSDRRQSASSFSYYYDCVTDARQHGYEVELTRAHGEMAPGGAECHLVNRA